MGDLVEKKQKQKDVLDRIRKSAATNIQNVLTESLELDFKCSATSQDFRVILEKESINGPYKIIRIVAATTRAKPRPSSSSVAKAVDINFKEIVGSIKCPFCKVVRYSVIKCGCGKLSCGGGVKKVNDKYLHSCPWCKSEGYIEGEFETVSGTRAEGGSLLPNKETKGRLPPTTHKMLGEG